MWNDRYIDPCGLRTRGAVFEPITIGTAGLMLAGIGGGVSAFGTLASGQKAEEAGQQSAAAQREGGELSAAAILQGGEFTAAGNEFQAGQLDRAAVDSRAVAERQAKGLTQSASDARAVGQRNAFDVKR